MRFIRREWAWLLGLLVAVFLVWGLHYDRLTPENWKVSPSYGTDSLSMMALIKAASEGDFVPFLPKTMSRLGAPDQAAWDDYPLMEELFVFVLGIFARWFGLTAAANFGVLLGHLTSALAFFIVCRYLRYHRVLSVAAAILFSFIYYHLWRSLPHLVVALSYTIPLTLLSTWLLAGSRRLRWGGKPFWFCVISALLIGQSNPYNLNLYFQLTLLGLAAHGLTRRRKLNLKIGGFCLALAAAMFFACNLDTFLYQWQHGKNTEGFFRAYFQCELYGLKPMELLVPPPEHNVGALAAIGKKYAASAWLKGEMFSPYLGLVAIGGLGWMMLEGARAALRRTRRRIPTHLLQALWVLLYSMVGGVNCLMALGGVVLFRSSNRYSMFIAALALLFLVSRASRLARRKTAGWSWGVAAAVVLVGLLDQLALPSHIGRATPQTDLGKQVLADRQFGAAMEAALPPGTLVFQLPVMEFPEAGWVHQASDYEMLRPYMFTKTLRFSYGHIRGRQREAWQHEVARLPAAQMVAELEKYGFGAIYLCRKGYQDNGESLLKQIIEAGRTNLIEDEIKEQVCIRLQPAAQPQKPATDALALLIPRAGWTATERTTGGVRRWSAGNARLDFFNPARAGTPYSLKCQIGSPTARLVVIRHGGREIWRGQLAAGQMAVVDAVVEAAKGNNVLEFLTDTPPIPAGPNTQQVIAFAVIDLKISRMGAP
jgi:phosphoglycerol transferase